MCALCKLGNHNDEIVAVHWDTEQQKILVRTRCVCCGRSKVSKRRGGFDNLRKLGRLGILEWERRLEPTRVKES